MSPVTVMLFPFPSHEKRVLGVVFSTCHPPATVTGVFDYLGLDHLYNCLLFNYPHQKPPWSMSARREGGEKRLASIWDVGSRDKTNPPPSL
jgi:hypothetical protein